MSPDKLRNSNFKEASPLQALQMLQLSEDLRPVADLILCVVAELITPEEAQAYLEDWDWDCG